MAYKLRLCLYAASVAGSSKSSLILRFCYIVHAVAMPCNFPLPRPRTVTKADVCLHAVLGTVCVFCVYLLVKMRNCVSDNVWVCVCVCVHACSILRMFDENPLEASGF